MSEAETATTRQTAVDRYLRAADVGAISLIAAFVIYFGFFPADDEMISAPVAIIAMIVVVVALWAMGHLFLRRKADEYTLALWHTGVTASFIALVIFGLFGDVIAALIEVGIFVATNRDVPVVDMRDEWTSTVCFTAFFVAFQYKRFKGAH